jgi:hypothetical protein
MSPLDVKLPEFKSELDTLNKERVVRNLAARLKKTYETEAEEERR